MKKLLALLTVLVLALTPCALAAAPEAEGPVAAAPAVEAAGDASFYLDGGGRLWAWGCNAYGQLGDGTQTDRSVPVKVLEHVAQVSAGDYHTLAVTDDGALWGWGLCQSNRLLDTKGDAAAWVGDREMPVQTTPVKLMDGVVRAAAGPWSTLVIKADGSLWTTTGVMMDEDGGWPDGEPGLVHLLDGAVDCAAGYDAACAILPDGTFYTWGPMRSADPVQAETYLVPTLADWMHITQASYGLGQVLSVRTDGALEYFGVSDRGQGAGESNFEYYGLPYRWGTVDLGVKVVQADSGAGFSAAVDENGGLWMWGRGDRGQLGNGRTGDTAQPVKALEDVAQVSCGYNHAVALKTDGTVWCWGDDSQSQLGLGRTGGKDDFRPAPAQAALTAPGSAREAGVKSDYSLTVDGEARNHWCYTLPREGAAGAVNGAYYSTLRSVAALLNGTPAQFDVAWDGVAQIVRITTGVPYEGTGDELTPPAAGTYAAVPAASAVYIDGRETALSGYVINGNHAYTINDLCAALGVKVTLGTGAGGGLMLDTAPLAYAKAVDDARTVEPEELLPLKTSITADNPYAVWNGAGDKVLVATWNDAPETYPDGGAVTVGEDPVWVFSGAELADWYAAGAGEVTDWELRLCQLIGLPPDAGYTSVTTLWVSPEDLFRPAFDPDITTNTMTTTLTGDAWYQDWFHANTAASYGEDGYPWTRLGYTYDWAENGTEYGLTEFIVRPGARVTVDRTLSTADYLSTLEN